MIKYPDIEITLVSFLKEELEQAGEENIIVSTKKSKTNGLKEIIITANYNNEITPVHRIASAIIDIYAPTYAEANTLSLTVESIIREATTGEIKKVEVIVGPTRTTETTQSERRTISIEMVVKANQINN